MSICASQLFLTCSYHWIFMKLTQNIRLKGQRSHRLFEVFIVSALWLCAYLTNSLHIFHKYNPRDDDVPHTISRSKGWRSGSHRLFKLRSRVALSFCHVCSVACCLFDRFVLYVVQIQPMKSWCVTHHFHFKGSKVQVTQARWKFWPYPLCVSLPIWLIDMWPRNKS